MICFNTHEDPAWCIDVSIALNCLNKVGLVKAMGGGMDVSYVVRRITPLEAERLQAFPDNYTNIEYNGKPAPDSLRYKALGNSMTVSVMRWIAQRILEVEKEDEDTIS